MEQELYVVENLHKQLLGHLSVVKAWVRLFCIYLCSISYFNIVLTHISVTYYYETERFFTYAFN